MLIFSEASKDKIEIQFPGRESKTNSENIFLSLSYFYRFDNYGIGVGTKILLCNYIFGKHQVRLGSNKFYHMGRFIQRDRAKIDLTRLVILLFRRRPFDGTLGITI